MYDLNLLAVNGALVTAIKLSVAARRVIGKAGEGYDAIMDIEREIREAAAECQRVLGLIKSDGNRPLIDGGQNDGV